MKRFLFPGLLVFVSVFAFNCQKEISTEWSPGSSTTFITTTVQGKIVDENGQPAAGVTVKAGSKTAITDVKGYFRIVKATLDKNASLVVAEKTGYFKAFRSFLATSGANHISIKLIKKVLAGTIGSAAGGDVVLSNGSKVNLPANAVVKAAGGSYNGTINVYSAYIDPTAADIAQTVPGSFMADDKNGKRVTLTSYGMLAVELESASGEKLQIAPGKTAALTSPIPSSILSSAPATIPLWYIDEQTGIWKEEGTAVKTGNSYVGDVKHFSFWNCDVGGNAITLTLTLKNAAGVPLVHAWVKLTRLSGNGGSAYGCTDSLGTISGLVPSNETLRLDVLDDCNTSAYTQNIGPFTQNTNLGVITVTSPLTSMFTIQGTVLNCNGAPVSNGFVIVDYDYSRYVNTNNSGQFSLAIFRCGTNPASFDITAVDNAAQQQATVTGIAIVMPVTNTGNLTACGTSSSQFINYALDGMNYVASSPGDTLFGYTGGQLNNYYTNMYGYHNSQNIIFSFNSNVIAPGTYPITYFSCQGYYPSQLLPPSEVVLSSFPAAVSGFYEGSFSGSFKDSVNILVTHTFSGNFRVRRN